MKHSDFSPSASKRWMLCPASIYEISKLPEDVRNQSTPYADRGTECHKAVQELDETGKIFVNLPEKWQEPAVVKALKMRDLLFNELKMEIGDNIRLETEVTLKHLGHPEIFGTADVIAYDDKTKTLVIVDYKFGQGVRVSPEWNSQLLIYALGALPLYPDTENIVLAIIQPRVSKAAKYFRLTREGAEKWFTDQLLPAIKKVNSEKPEYNPTEEACRWCPASGYNCAALLESVMNLLPKIEEADITQEVDVGLLSKILAEKKKLLQTIKKLEARAVKLAQQGTRIPGFKLVKAYGNTRWTVPDEDIEKWLRNKRFKKLECYTLKILSPKQVKDALNEKNKLTQANLAWIESNSERPEKGLVLVPESDPRPEAIDAITELDLENLL